MGHVSPVNLHGIDYISYVYYNQDPDNFDKGKEYKKNVFLLAKFFCSSFARFNEEDFFTFLHVIYQLNQTMFNKKLVEWGGVTKHNPLENR